MKTSESVFLIGGSRDECPTVAVATLRQVFAFHSQPLARAHCSTSMLTVPMTTPRTILTTVLKQ
jgi:hypothetical protein